MNVALIEEDPKPGSYWCAVAPIDINQCRYADVHHDQFLKRYDEFRGHAQTEPRPPAPRRGKKPDLLRTKM